MATTATSSEKKPGCMDQGWIPPKWLVTGWWMLVEDAEIH